MPMANLREKDKKIIFIIAWYYFSYIITNADVNLSNFSKTKIFQILTLLGFGILKIQKSCEQSHVISCLHAALEPVFAALAVWAVE